MAETTRYADGERTAFLVDDGTGRAYVDPEEAELLLTSGDEVVVEADEEPPARIREFVERETDLEAVSRRRRRYKEVRIGVGDRTLVAGSADPDGTPDVHERVTTAIVERGDAPRFYVTDDPDRGLGRRLQREAFGYFLAAAILLATTYYLVAV